MPLLYSRKEGENNHKTLFITDYIIGFNQGLLSPDTIDCGVFTYFDLNSPAPKDYICSVQAHCQQLVIQSRIPEARKVFPHPNNSNLPITARANSVMAATRRPSLLVNGLPSVSEDGSNPSTLVNPEIAAVASSASPQRAVAKNNMLRRMRPPPFQHAWTFYHDKHSEHGSYEGRLTVLLENIITIKPFWEAYNDFPLEALKMKDSVHFFKRGVKPVWEDPRNVKGGAWTFRVPKDKSEETWKEMLLLAVGEQFADVIQPKDDLCGMSLSVRFNSNLIMIWNRDGTAQKSIDGIRDVVLKNLSPEIKPKDGSYYYKQHSDHAGFSEVLAKAAENALISGKIEEARVKEGEIEKAMMEEQEAEEAEKSRRRSQTVT